MITRVCGKCHLPRWAQAKRIAKVYVAKTKVCKPCRRKHQIKPLEAKRGPVLKRQKGRRHKKGSRGG